MTTPDEPASDAESDPSADRHRWDAVHLTIVALAVVLVVMAGVWGFQRIRGSQASATFCAGVGLEGPSAATPEAALAAFLATYPSSGAPDDWARTDEFGDSPTAVHFRPRSTAVSSYRAVTAYGSAGSWSIGGACV